MPGVFARQVEAEAELRALAAERGVLDLLAVRGLGLIGLSGALLRGPLAERTDSVRVRVLLLDPDTPAAAMRAAEIGECPEAFCAGIRLSISRLADFADYPLVAGDQAGERAVPVSVRSAVRGSPVGDV